MKKRIGHEKKALHEKKVVIMLVSFIFMANIRNNENKHNN